MGSLARKAAIVGAYEHPLRVAPGYTEMGIEAECAREALEGAGLTLKDVDGFFGVTAPVENMSAATYCDYLNIHPRIVGDTNIGGATFLRFVLEAASFINAGLMNVGLITYSQLLVSRGWGLFRPISFSVLTDPTTINRTDPPRPPSPPSGPPSGTYFSRRKLTQPAPPVPPVTVISIRSIMVILIISKWLKSVDAEYSS